MAIVQRLAALVIATLPLSALAEPLMLNLTTTGNVSAIDGSLYGLTPPMQTGASLTVDFATELDLSSATVTGNLFTTQPTNYFWNFGLAANGMHIGLQAGSSMPSVPNQIALQDNVLNAANVLVDVFEMTSFGSNGNTTYLVTQHLEFSPSTFEGLDAWSILALETAPLLEGTMHVSRVTEGWDATFHVTDIDADVNSFAIQFSGPGAEIPAVPEPGGYALLLAGLASVAGTRDLRRRLRQDRG